MPPKKNNVNAEQILEKIGAKKVDGANKVSFYRGDQEFSIAQPKVYYNEQTQMYYFVGEPRIQDYNAQTQYMLNMFN